MKCLVFVTLLLTLVLTVFAGDSCIAEGRPAECKLLSLCQPLLTEIQNGGTPMPSHLRRKLQALSCGFESDEPLVCCVPPFTNINNQGTEGSSHNWLPPTDQGMGTITDQWGISKPINNDNTNNQGTGGGNSQNWLPPTDQGMGTITNQWGIPKPIDNENTNNQGNGGGSSHNWLPPTDQGMGTITNPWETPKPNSNVDPWETNNNNMNQNTNKDEKRQTPGLNSKDNIPTSNNNRETPPDVQGHHNLGLLPNNCGVVDSDRIWGGNRTRLYEMPWMVLVAYDSPRGTKLSCGGTLITERYVLTAAHCVSFLGSRLKLSGIVLGEHDVRQDPDCERMEGEQHCAPNVRNATIESIIAHPGYSPQNLYDDIALVRLAEPADFTIDSMKPICLPSTPELQAESLVGLNGIVAGWGATEDGLQSPVLLSVDLPIVSNRDCQAAYNGSPKIYNRQMCAGGVEDKDSCGGDSGGPLMYPGRIKKGGVRYVQRGIVSYGSKRCGLGGFPGVYTRVGHYMDWILDNISN